jgi:hypothetical protein
MALASSLRCYPLKQLAQLRFPLLCRSVIEVRNGFTFLDLIVIQIEVLFS